MKKIYKQISGALLMLTLILNITACQVSLVASGSVTVYVPLTSE